MLALVQEGRWTEALDRDGQQDPILKAYCLYRLRRLPESLNMLDGCETENTASLHLRAQIYYSMGRFSDAARLYAEKLPKSSDAYQSEVVTNRLAAQVAGIEASRITGTNCDILSVDYKSLLMHSENTFEVMFNRALLCTALGRLEESQIILERLSVTTGEELKENGADQMEIDKETAKVHIQLALVYQLRSNPKSVAQYDIAARDVSGDCIVSNNLAVMNGPTLHVDSIRKLKKCSTLNGKLLSYQNAYLLFNSAILLARMKRYGPSTSAALRLSKQYPESAVPALIHAGNCLSQNKKHAAFVVLKASITLQLYRLINIHRMPFPRTKPLYLYVFHW